MSNINKCQAKYKILRRRLQVIVIHSPERIVPSGPTGEACLAIQPAKMVNTLIQIQPCLSLETAEIIAVPTLLGIAGRKMEWRVVIDFLA